MNININIFFKNKQFLIGIGCLGFTILMFFQLEDIALQARMFPKYITILLFGLSIFLTLNALVKGLNNDQTVQSKSNGKIKDEILIILTLVIYFILISRIGTYVTTYFFALFIFAFASKKFSMPVLIKGGIFSLILTFALYLLFRFVMKAPMPSGLFF